MVANVTIVTFRASGFRGSECPLKPADKSRQLCHSLAVVLSKRREALGLSQTKLAELSGLTRQMISFVEKGRRIPTVDSIAKLATALNASPSALMAEAEKACAF